MKKFRNGDNVVETADELLAGDFISDELREWVAKAIPGDVFEDGAGFEIECIEVPIKVKDLIKKLQEVNPELDVVLTINDGDITSWELQEISLGWEPSGVVSLESDNCILN